MHLTCANAECLRYTERIRIPGGAAVGQGYSAAWCLARAWHRQARLEGRLVLFTTAGAVRLPEARFEAGDTLLFGSESRGAPEEVHERADLRVRIPQAGNAVAEPGCGGGDRGG